MVHVDSFFPSTSIQTLLSRNIFWIPFDCLLPRQVWLVLTSLHISHTLWCHDAPL